MLLRLSLVVLILPLVSCCENSKTEYSEEYLRGEQVYKNVCITCHNRDPRLVGALAPDIAGSKEEVIRSMILYGKPPEGVAPKWTHMNMAPIPHLESEVPYLYEYLKTFK